MVLLTVTIVLIIIWLVSTMKKPSKFPPGPPKVPFLGGTPFIMQRGSLFHGLRKLVSEYGPLSGFYFGNTPVVVVADYQILRELFKRDDVSFRPSVEPNNRLRTGWEHMDNDNKTQGPGVILTNGHYWKEQRRFLLKNLKDFGFGKKSMETFLLDEMAKLCSKMSKIPENEAFNLNRTLNISILNALWNILVGETLDLNDPESSNFVILLDNLFREGGTLLTPEAGLLPFPSMVTWPILKTIFGYDRSIVMHNAAMKFLQRYVDDHKKTLDPNNIRDFCDLMLIEIQNTHDESSSFYRKKGESTLLCELFDLLVAGMETTSSSLVWLFLHLIHHPEKQKRVHDELDAIVGRNRFPSLDDRPQMHYTNAVLFESLRLASLAGLGVPHMAIKDVELNGYIIPAGATVFGSLHHIMNDPDHFKNPDSFEPERFLDENGNFRHDDRVMPFGTGKRVCLGQTLAEKEYFLFFVGIMQRFELMKAKDKTLPEYGIESTNPKDFLRVPPNYFVNVVQRKGF